MATSNQSMTGAGGIPSEETGPRARRVWPTRACHAVSMKGMAVQDVQVAHDGSAPGRVRAARAAGVTPAWVARVAAAGPGRLQTTIRGPAAADRVVRDHRRRPEPGV